MHMHMHMHVHARVGTIRVGVRCIGYYTITITHASETRHGTRTKVLEEHACRGTQSSANRASEVRRIALGLNVTARVGEAVGARRPSLGADLRVAPCVRHRYSVVDAFDKMR